MKTTAPSANVNFETSLPRILALTLLAILLLLALTGRKSEAQDLVSTNAAGVYTLVSVDGKTLPCSLAHEGAAPTIKAGSFTINAHGTCCSQITFSVPERGDMNREVKAAYTQKGAELTMQWEGAGMTKGSINGDQFTMTNEGMVFSYRK